jgi:hypothetical protein
MNWAMMANLTWDYGQDTIGDITGFAVELNQPKWAVRYGFFQMPRDKNGFTGNDQFLMWPRRGAYGPFLRAWAMMTEFERRYSVHTHPGAIRFLAWLNEADMASYQAAIPILKANGVGADLSAARSIAAARKSSKPTAISKSAKMSTPRWITSSSPTRRSTVTAGRCQFSGRDFTGNFNERTGLYG